MMNSEKAFLAQILQKNDIYYYTQPQVWWFTTPETRRVFLAIEKALETGSADIVTVGGITDPSYVAGLSDIGVSPANAKYYAQKCAEGGAKEELRKLSHIISDGVKNATLDEVMQSIDDIVDKIVSGSDEYHIKDARELLVPLVDEFEERYNKRGELPGLQTHFEALDNILMGLQPERMYVIGARPSQGKSALMLNIADKISNHHIVGVITLESGWREVLTREMSTLSGINSQRLLSGYFSRMDFGRLTDAAGQLSGKKLYIYDKPNASLQEVVGQARRMVQRYKCDVIFIDYLQLIRVPEADGKTEQTQTSSTRIKSLSRELKIPIVALAQLRRDSDGRRPTLGDFQHSSQIEQDADAGMLIYHKIVDAGGKNLHKVRAEEGERDEIFLLVDKNRDGRTGAVPLDFNAEIVKFTERC